MSVTHGCWPRTAAGSTAGDTWNASVSAWRPAGIERVVVEATLARFDRAGELDAAVALIHKRFPAPLCDDRERQRAFGMLSRKGFESSVVYEAIARSERE